MHNKNIEEVIKKEEHSEMGGSGAHVWLECPGSIFLARELKKKGIDINPDSAASIRGTKAHAIAAECLGCFLESLKDPKGTTLTSDALLDSVTKEVDADFKESVAEYINTVWHKGMEGWLTDKTYEIEKTIYLHERLNIFGTVDFYCHYNNDKGQHVLYVCDYKSGVVPVPHPSNNYQLFFYALGVFNELKKQGITVDVIKLAICQPDEYTGNNYSEAVIKPKKLKSFEARITKAAKQVYIDLKSKFKVGDHCSECSALAHCTAYFNHALRQVEQLDKPAVTKGLIPIETLSEDKMLQIAMNKDALKKYIDAVYAHSIGCVLSGTFKSKEYKVVLSGGKRAWKEDKEAEIINFLNSRGIKPFKLKTSLVPFGPVEKQLGKGAIDDYVEKKPGALTLVSSDDPRPAADVLEASAKEILELEI